MQLDDYLAGARSPSDAMQREDLGALLRARSAGANGRAFILDESGVIIASSDGANNTIISTNVSAAHVWAALT